MASFLRFGCGQLAMLAALGIFAGSPASAADLGGNCCADLEERIAELEATAARKGNRKVKLEVSGQVNEAVLFWDDGFESNVGAYTNENARTRFRFKGDAKIADGWKAGYLLEVGVRSSNSSTFDQDNDNGTGSVGFDLRHSTWYIDSKSYGRVWVGLTGGAAEGITEVNLAATKDVLKYSDQQDNGLGLALRQTDGTFTNGLNTTFNDDDTPVQGLTWRRLIRDSADQPGEGRRQNLVRYDTPEIFGFVSTVNFGEDDTWEVGTRYSGEFNGFKLAAGIAYGENTDGGSGNQGFQCLARSDAGIPAGSGTDTKCSQIGGSISVMHVESGLYANFAAGQLEDDLIDIRFGAGADDTSEFFALEAGIERKFIPLGKTTVFGQYYKNDGGTNTRRDFDGSSFTSGAANNLANTELESFGLGVIQGIDAAAMHVYLTYRHYEADVELRDGSSPGLEDLDVVMGGALIKF